MPVSVSVCAVALICVKELRRITAEREKEKESGGELVQPRGRFSEATGGTGIHASVELDYTAKGYIYRARMYAEARTLLQRNRSSNLALT